MASDNKKKQKNMKKSKKGIIITVLVCTVLVLSAVAYIVYFTGLIPKVATGMEVTQTTAEGQTKKIEKISVLEMNYHTRQVMQSIGVSGDMWDQVMETTTGKTVGDFILEKSAEEIKNCVVVNNAAKENGYDDHGGARRYAEFMTEGISFYADTSKITEDQYLSGIYGVGMTKRLFIQYTERMALTSEYESYVQQFVNAPSNEEIQATFDENPGSFQKANLSSRILQVGTEENMYATIEDAQADADKIIAALDGMDEINDETFVVAVDSVVGGGTDKKDDGASLYYTEGYSKGMGYIPEAVSDYIFDAATENGSYTSIATENGVYIVAVYSKDVDETPTVSYRTSTVYLASQGGDYQKALDAANQFVATPTDSLGFDTYVKTESVYANEILTGGYYEGITAADFEGTDEQPAADIDVAISNWLFDTNRKPGDMKVFTSADMSSIRVVYFEAATPRWMQICRIQARSLLQDQWKNELALDNYSYVIYPDQIVKFTYGASDLP